MGLISRLGRSPGVENGTPLQYSCLKNPMDRRTWKATVHGVTKSPTQLSTVSRVFDFMIVLNRIPGGSDSKASVYNAGDPGLSPGLGRSPEEGNGNPLQYYSLENPMDIGAW